MFLVNSLVFLSHLVAIARSTPAVLCRQEGLLLTLVELQSSDFTYVARNCLGIANEVVTDHALGSPSGLPSGWDSKASSGVVRLVLETMHHHRLSLMKQ